ncbi:hypothetical protein CU669_17615 [Paramagnetospirillum kuznetsovii]|uniref:Uncharacterized protein n=1 Tax=Paramagnetospirillum kuznetsovii TaxID=2053833 RepID=A0A364NU47_9PROT|nr:hypothetical protein [Paramagnetospirillum kuznetsovii]RAU20594.1 hypothetical protein CU669_17615 [Paramagnetospirillum kuznetsovii]
MSAKPTSIWLRLAQSLRTIWDDDAPDSQAPVGKAKVQANRSRTEATELAANTLRDQLLNDPTLQARLHIISLAEFRESVGDKWARLADKVAMIVEQVIRRHVGRDNPFCRDGEDSWILAFPRLSPDQARQCTLGIIDDLGRHLFGGETPLNQKPMAVAAEVFVADAVADDGDLHAHRIRAAVDERRARSGPETVSESANRWTSMGRGDQAIKADDMGWESMDATSARKSIAFDPDMIGPLPPTAKLSLLWRPTWVASGEAISAYGARIIRIDRDGAEPIEGVRAYPPGDEKTALTLDRFVVANAVRDIKAGARSGDEAANQASVIVPISWSSLASDQRGSIVVPFSDLTQQIRNTRLVVEIFGIPDGTATPELEAVVSYVRSLCREVLVRTHLSAKRSSLAAEIGVSMVGLDLSELLPEEKMDDEHLLETLDRIQESTARDGIGCYLWSARRRRVVGGVVKGGFGMVNGPGLMKDIPRPAMVVPAPRSRFIAA